MTCRDARKIMHLYRPGELSPAEQQSLRDHVHSCPACAQEERRIGYYDRLLFSMRNAKPVITDREQLTSTIMHRIEGSHGKADSNDLTMRMDEVFFRRGRTAFAVAVCGLVLLCAGQTYTDARRLENLEGRLRTAALQRGSEFRVPSSVGGSLRVITDLRRQLHECGQTPFPQACLSAFAGRAIPLLLKAEKFRPSIAAQSANALTDKYGALILNLSSGYGEYEHPMHIVAEGNRLLDDVEQLLLQGGTLP